MRKYENGNTVNREDQTRVRQILKRKGYRVNNFAPRLKESRNPIDEDSITSEIEVDGFYIRFYKKELSSINFGGGKPYISKPFLATCADYVRL
jgi:hypothetical protein